jgi:hypothetical protein
MNIFISYASKNRTVVRSLVEDLELLEHIVWFDQELSGGQVWWDRITQSIQQCDVFIFALTPESLDSYPCKLECNYAQVLKKRILPVLLAEINTSLLPPVLAEIQYVDYRQMDRKAALLLNRALNSLPPAVPCPDPLPIPPAAPLSPLGEINERIDAPALTLEEQAALFIRLKGLLKRPDTAQDARVLLMRLRTRHDLFATISEEVEQVLAGIEHPISKSTDQSWQPAQPEIEPPAVVRPINLGFEGAVVDGQPWGWFNSLGLVMGVSTAYKIQLVPRRGGGVCVLLQNPTAREDEFGSLMQRCPAHYLAGKVIRFEGEVRTEDVKQWAGLWLRADGDTSPDLFFDNMSQRPIRGSTGWTKYVIDAQLPEQTAWLNYGIVLAGPGTMWADNFRLLVWENDQWFEV